MTPTLRWPAVAASACGLAVGQGPISVFAAGVFITPIAQDLNLGRGVLSTAIGVSNLVGAVAAPFFGRALDAWGVRRPLLASIALFAAATATMGLMPASVPMVFLLYGISGLVGIGQNPTAYSKVLASHFDRRRGLALGLALGGVGLGTAFMPAVTSRLIAAFGWRASYVWLGVLVLLLAFVPVLLFLPEPRARHSIDTADLPGDSFADALRHHRYWSLALAFFLMTVAINGTLVHVVPLLTDRGMAPATAAAVLGAAGLALVVGRVLAGFLMDRIFAPYVAIVSVAGPLCGIAVLGWNIAGLPPAVGTALLGLGIGAEVDLMWFLVTRYFGLRAFGALHALMFSALILGNAAGAAAMGWSFELGGSYQPVLVVFEVLLVVSAALFLRLGPYTYPARPA